MFAKRRVRWLARLALAVAALLIDANAARADTWTWLNGCDCNDQLPASGWVAPQPMSCPTRPCWARPTTPYNSSWARVPVTNYRPQAVTDPLSGVSFTSLQPCGTYEWQLRRTAGCSLWQSFVNWWNSRCRCIGSPSMSPATTICTPTSEWVVTSPERLESPYYAPSTNGRLVPVPSSVSPASPVPADRRPRLDPPPQRPSSQGAASPRSLPDAEIFVRALDGPDASLEFGPPLIAPGLRGADADVAEDHAASVGEMSLELLPVNWSVPAATYDRTLPTNEVWDDTGWQSEQ